MSLYRNVIMCVWNDLCVWAAVKGETAHRRNPSLCGTSLSVNWRNYVQVIRTRMCLINLSHYLFKMFFVAVVFRCSSLAHSNKSKGRGLENSFLVPQSTVYPIILPFFFMVVLWCPCTGFLWIFNNNVKYELLNGIADRCCDEYKLVRWNNWKWPTRILTQKLQDWK